MPDQEQERQPAQKVDGFSDNMKQEKMPTHGEKQGIPSAPDLGEEHGAKPPLDPQEYAKMKQEAEKNNE